MSCSNWNSPEPAVLASSLTQQLAYLIIQPNRLQSSSRVQGHRDGQLQESLQLDRGGGARLGHSSVPLQPSHLPASSQQPCHLRPGPAEDERASAGADGGGTEAAEGNPPGHSAAESSGGAGEPQRHLCGMLLLLTRRRDPSCAYLFLRTEKRRRREAAFRIIDLKKTVRLVLPPCYFSESSPCVFSPTRCSATSLFFIFFYNAQWTIQLQS
ncbi:uncharacterized protein LOC118228807 isoform X1 [Anguilla anguilla]|uniref:uncharacterized protein LOC118228807 isoform X1 n=1 Tax=Anguilla anguilla TaxID=7936 RepID=UPI0015AA64A9|nr:uncharacterized protein LOC118228807 isoform X1 [Anguilla anguilla]